MIPQIIVVSNKPHLYENTAFCVEDEIKGMALVAHILVYLFQKQFYLPYSL